MTQAFKTELVAMQQLLTQQSSVLSGDHIAKLTALQGSAFTTRASQLRGLTTDDVSELTTIIQTGPWPASHQASLIMALATALAGGDATPKKDKREQQSLSHFSNYTTDEERSALCNPHLSMTVKVTVALDVLERICAVLLRETSKRHVLATVCAVHLQPQGWTALDLRSWYVYFKGQYMSRFKNKRADPGIGHITLYPEDPSMLQPSQVQLMFGASAAAKLEVPLDIATKLEAAIWCRGNAMALRHNTEHVVTGAELQLRQPAALESAASNANPMNQMMMMMMNMMQHTQGMNMQGPQIQLTPPSTRCGPQPGLAKRASSSNSIGGCQAIEDTPEPSTPIAPANELPPQSGLTPSPLTVPKGSSMTPQEQADKFMAALNTGDIADDDADDNGPASDNGAATDNAAATRKTAAAGTGAGKTTIDKGKATKKVTSGKAKAKAPAVIKKGDKKAELIFKPTYCLEATRSQFLCRPGLPASVGGESSKCFRFIEHGGQAGAEKAAQKWVRDFKATHKCSN